MLVTHIYLNGQCKEAIEMYQEALNASVKTVIEDSNQQFVVHAEIIIHDQLLMLNDFGNNDGISKSGGYQLAVRFENETDLKRAYSIMQSDGIVIYPMQATDYSPCVVRFIDRFDVRWAFWI
jgi:PhnB protein